MEFSKNTKSVLKLDLDALGNWGLATICGIERFPASLTKNKTSEKGTSASLNLKPASQNRHKSLYRLSAIKSLLHYLLTFICNADFVCCCPPELIYWNKSSNLKITETHSDQSDLGGLNFLDVFLTVSKKEWSGSNRRFVCPLSWIICTWHHPMNSFALILD